MVVEIIASIIFLISLGAIVFIVYKKIPELNTLPKNGSIGIREHHLIQNIEKKIKEYLIAFEKQVWLHKALSWIKIMVLKVEVKIDHLLHGIRKKAQEIDKKKK